MSEMIPPLSKTISNDGREIWDWASKLGGHIDREDRKRKLRQQIADLKSKCGSCNLWMTPSCPREVHNGRTGRWTGPSMNASACEKFSMKSWDADLLGKLTAELVALTAERSDAPPRSSEEGPTS